ncbi:MAG TPA: FkbM family methyltransferase [Nitrososphaerales archaeon]|nr:FkbM family methyltransferase [Nitrososphaerales archaeon]
MELGRVVHNRRVQWVRRAVWSTRPESSRLAYYSFVLRRALRPEGTAIREDAIVEHGGVRFLLPKDDSEVLYSVFIDEMEPLTCKLMTSLKGSVFVDVGANVGAYTVRLGSLFGKIVSIEPNPRAAEVLRRNIELNHLHNVDVVEEAVSDSAGETTMNVPSSGKTTRSSIVESYNKGSYFKVETNTLDRLLDEFTKIDLLKIDAEMAEVKVLNGAEMTLDKTATVIIETGSWSEKRVTEILEKHGFDVADLDIKVNECKNVSATRTNDNRSQSHTQASSM